MHHGYIRFYARYRREGNEVALARLNGCCLLLLSGIGALVLTFGIFLSYHLPLLYGTGLSASEYRVAETLFRVLTVYQAVLFPMSAFSEIVSAHERFLFLKVVGIVKTVLVPIVTVPLLLVGKSCIAMAIALLFVAVLTELAYAIYVKRVLHCRFSFRMPEHGFLGSLLSYTAFIAIGLLVDQINAGLDRFLLGRSVGTVAVAVYAVGHALYQYYMMFSTSVSGLLAPRVHRIVHETEDPALRGDRLSALFLCVGRLQFLLLSLLATGVIFFGRPFLLHWVGEGYDDAYAIALLLILPATVPFIQNVGIEIQRALNLHRFRSIAYLGMAGLNLLLTLSLIPRLGAVGAAVGTAVSLLLANGILMNVYYSRRCGLNILGFWKGILRLSAGLPLPLAVGALLSCVLPMRSIAGLLVGIVIYTATYGASMWLFGMNSYEKDLVRNPIRRLLKRTS